MEVNDVLPETFDLKNCLFQELSAIISTSTALIYNVDQKAHCLYFVCRWRKLIKNDDKDQTFHAIYRKRYDILDQALYKVQSNVCMTDISYDSFQLYANEFFYLVLSIVAD